MIYYDIGHEATKCYRRIVSTEGTPPVLQDVRTHESLCIHQTILKGKLIHYILSTRCRTMVEISHQNWSVDITYLLKQSLDFIIVLLLVSSILQWYRRTP